MHSTWKNKKKWYNSNRFKKPAPTLNEKKNWLLDESYYVSDIQDYLNISLTFGEKTDNHSIRIYVNLTFKLKKENDLELVSPETIKLLRTIKVR